MMFDIVPKACDYSLNNLACIDYFDLSLIHFPVCWKHTGLDTPSWGNSELGTTSTLDTWKAMEKLVQVGKCRNIGVSNFPLCMLHDLYISASIKPSCNQIEVHPYYTRESLVNYCLSRDICVTAHTPLGGGTLNKQTWATTNVGGQGGGSSSIFDTIPIEDPTLQQIGLKFKNKKSAAQVCLRYLLQCGICVIPKSIRKTRMIENFDILGAANFEISEDDMANISKLDKYISYKTNPNPLSAFINGKDQFTVNGTDIFD